MNLVPHPLFEKNIVDLKQRWVTRFANRFLSMGGACYYLCDQGVSTRIHLYNYFALLNAGDFRAHWTVRAYTTDGKSFREKSGAFQGLETVPIDVASFAPSPTGLCIAYIDPEDHARTIRKSFATIFYVEYYTASSSAYIHSLGYPVPKLYNAHDYIVTSIRTDCDPQLLLSNSCQRLLNTPRVFSRQGPRIELENHRLEIRKAEVAPVAPLSCHRVRLQDLWHDLESFLDGQPALMRVKGPNVLYSPLFMQKTGTGLLSVEHFQGLDWEDL